MAVHRFVGELNAQIDALPNNDPSVAKLSRQRDAAKANIQNPLLRPNA